MGEIEGLIFNILQLECFNWSRKSYLGPTEIASCVFLVLFKDVGCKVSPKCFLYVFDVSQEKETG